MRKTRIANPKRNIISSVHFGWHGSLSCFPTAFVISIQEQLLNYRKKKR